jgi:hypothetical protein
MLEQLLKQLYETWGYSTEEIDDIREKMQDLGKSCYDQGHTDASMLSRHKSLYGKKEDMEFYD